MRPLRGKNGFAQLDIEVRSDNVRAIRLYERNSTKQWDFRPIATISSCRPPPGGSQKTD